MKNPLGYIDPSGYSWLSKTWKKIWKSPVGRIAITVAVAWVTGYYDGGIFANAGWGATTTAIANTAAAGFASGYVGSGWDFRAGLQGSFTALLFYGAGSFAGYQGWGEGSFGRAAAHAVAGCVGAAAGGGRCGNGALAAGFAEGIGGHLQFKSVEANLVARTVIGGTASVLGGGKFANGAATAAFGYLFNHCSHGGCTTKLEQVLYDWWPGYKAGTLIYNQTMGDGSWTGWEVLDAASVGVGVAARGLQALRAGAAFADVGIEFGANANQVSHAFRHIDAIGLSRDAITTAIRADVPALQVGQGVTRTVTVNGIDLTYRAHRVNETLVNVGRVTPPRP